MVFSNQGTYPEFEDTILCNIIEKANIGMFKQTWLTWQLYWGYSFWSGSIWIYPDPCLKIINFVKTTTYYLLGRQESTCTRIHLCRVVLNMKEAQDMFFFFKKFSVLWFSGGLGLDDSKLEQCRDSLSWPWSPAGGWFTGRYHLLLSVFHSNPHSPCYFHWINPT